MFLSSTTDGFRAAVRSLRSLDGKECLSFQIFTLPEDSCVRLLVKNLDRGIPESVVGDKLESLNISFQIVTQLSSGRRDQDRANDRPPTSSFKVSVAHGPAVSKVRALTELESVGGVVRSRESPISIKRCQRFGHTQNNCRYAYRCVVCREPPPLWRLRYPA